MTHPASGPPGAATHQEVPCARTAVGSRNGFPLTSLLPGVMVSPTSASQPGATPVIECHMVDQSSLRSLMTQLLEVRGSAQPAADVTWPDGAFATRPGRRWPSPTHGEEHAWNREPPSRHFAALRSSLASGLDARSASVTGPSSNVIPRSRPPIDFPR
jgi:hypothetical protein